MNTKTYNKALSQQAKKALNFSFTKQSDPADDQTYFCNDTDGVKYRIHATAKKVVLLFIANDVKIVWNYSGQYMKNKYYKYAKVALAKDQDGRDAIQIEIDEQVVKDYNQNFVAKVQSGITTGGKKFDALFQYLGKKLASIKRHFFASPYQMMAQTAIHNHVNKDSKKLPNLVYNIRPGGSERVWISFQKNQFTVYFGLSFQDRSEQQLCKILLSQLVDSKKHVQNSHSVSVSETDIPKFLIESFPEQKTKKYAFTNGITSITIFGQLAKKPQSIATFLAGFRNYIYYHIQAQKCYLHSRELRIINGLHTNIKQTKIEPFSIN